MNEIKLTIREVNSAMQAIKMLDLSSGVEEPIVSFLEECIFGCLEARKKGIVLSEDSNLAHFVKEISCQNEVNAKERSEKQTVSRSTYQKRRHASVLRKIAEELLFENVQGDS